MNKNVWLLSASQSLMMTNNALFVTASALVGAILAENISLATLPLALQFMATMLATIPASLLMKRFGRKKGFLLGTVIGLSGAITATNAIMQTDFWLFCMGTFLIGMSNGFGNYYRFAAVDVVEKNLKSRAISYVMAGGVVAAIFGPNIASWAHGAIEGAAFAGSYLVICILFVIIFIVLSFVKIPQIIDQEFDKQQIRPLGVLIKQPVFMVAVLSGMLGYAVMSLIMTATPLSMSHHHSLSDTAFIIQWHVLGMFAPSFFTGRLINRFGVINIMLVGAILLLMAVAGNLMGVTLWHYWFALFSLGVGWNFVFIGATDLLTYTYHESEKAKAQAFNDFFVYGSVTASALTASYLQHHYGWYIVNLGVLPMILSVLVALAWLRLKHRDLINLQAITA